MTAYLTIEPLIHDGETYPPGATLALDDHHAKPLLALGAIKAAPVTTEALTVTNPPPVTETGTDAPPAASPTPATPATAPAPKARAAK